MASTYVVVMVNRAGREHRRPYTAESELAPGSVIRRLGHMFTTGQVSWQV